MDLAQAFHQVVDMADRAESASGGFQDLLAFLEAHAPYSLSSLRTIDIVQDVSRLRTQLAELLRSEPPPTSVDTLYFGLFDGADDNGIEQIGFYVAGVEGFEPTNPDSLCEPVWWPEGRHLSSDALDAVKAAELSAAHKELQDERQLLGYAGQLGVGLLVSKFASAGLRPGTRCVVGFDSGDFSEVRPAG